MFYTLLALEGISDFYFWAVDKERLTTLQICLRRD